MDIEKDGFKKLPYRHLSYLKMPSDDKQVCKSHFVMLKTTFNRYTCGLFYQIKLSDWVTLHGIRACKNCDSKILPSV